MSCKAIVKSRNIVTKAYDVMTADFGGLKATVTFVPETGSYTFSFVNKDGDTKTLSFPDRDFFEDQIGRITDILFNMIDEATIAAKADFQLQKAKEAIKKKSNSKEIALKNDAPFS